MTAVLEDGFRRLMTLAVEIRDLGLKAMKG